MSRLIDLDALIRAHPYITVQRPPTLWVPDSDAEKFVACFGELIAASLFRNGGDLTKVTIQFANVVIAPEPDDPMPSGEFLGVSSVGQGDWGPEISRRPQSAAAPWLLSRDLETAAHAAGARWGYTRAGNGTGSVMLLFARARPKDHR